MCYGREKKSQILKKMLGLKCDALRFWGSTDSLLAGNELRPHGRFHIHWIEGRAGSRVRNSRLSSQVHGSILYPQTDRTHLHKNAQEEQVSPFTSIHLNI